ncbi:MAG: hypothetical protein D6715_03410 [Calditrichaeota bacterium]|nr:MAG: hypothetical protein D6715_03410 [Calditrichota bacterium]
MKLNLPSVSLKRMTFPAFLFASLVFFSGLFAQTVENPVQISVKPASPVVHPGEQSALIVTLRIPQGFWIAASTHATRITPIADQVFQFQPPRFPRPDVAGVPVHLGTRQVYTGEVQAVVPFTVSPGAAPGAYTITLEITYIPALNAGELSTHFKEPYTTRIRVVFGGGGGGNPGLPQPARRPVPPDFLVKERKLQLPAPLSSMFYTWSEQSAVPRFLHRLFIDPPNHGKHIQTVWTPVVGSTENNGQSLGMGVALMNVTREGIMTGTLQFRGLYNEYAGATAGMEVISCPAAYFNYRFSAEISEDKNRQARFHMENLTLGKNDRFGFELQANAFQDPRYRFSGLGGATNEEDQTNYTHEEFGGFLDVYWLPVNHWRFFVGGRIRSVDVKRGADRLADDFPYTVDVAAFRNVPGIDGATVVGQEAGFVYDGRNQEFTPSRGTYFKFTAEFNQVTSSPKPVSTYGRFRTEFRRYFSTVDKRYTLLVRNSLTFTTSEKIPFFDQATLGGLENLRAFDLGRFYGQHAVFGSVELRYQAMHKVMMGFPMDLEVAPFVDFGQVFNSTDFEGEFNVNPGLSLRVLNKPNIGLIVNGAVGQDGVIFTGGVDFPF